MLSQKFQKYISDYISRHRNSKNPWRWNLRRLYKKFFYQAPGERLEKIVALKRAGRHHEYYLGLRDAAIEFARHDQAGEAVKLASALPAEYINAHLANCLKIVQRADGQGLSASIETITVCNLRCPLCSHGDMETYRGAPLNTIMPLATFKNIWDKIKHRAATLQLIGQGEIFLHPNVYEMLDYVSPTVVTLDTNGNAPLDPARLINTNLRYIYFSIDGVDQRTYEKYRVGGNFEKATGALRELAAAKKAAKAEWPRIVFKYIPFKHNEMYLEEARKLAAELGADEFLAHVAAVFPGTRDYEGKIREFMPLVSIAEKFVEYFELETQTVVMSGDFSPYCSAPMTGFCIRLDGLVLPCGGTSAEPFEGLNIFDHSIDDIWRNEKYAGLRQAALKNRYDLEYCRGCYCGRKNAWRRAFNEVELAYPRPRPPRPPFIRYDDLKIDEAYAQKLRDENLHDELQYFKDGGKYDGPKGGHELRKD